MQEEKKENWQEDLANEYNAAAQSEAGDGKS